MTGMDDIRVLWLRPDTGENVSTRRTRIAEHLGSADVDVEFLTVGHADVLSAVWQPLVTDADVVIANVRLPMYASFPSATLRDLPFIADVSDPISQIADLPRPLFATLRQYEYAVLTRADAAFFAESDSYDTAIARGVRAKLAKNGVNYEAFANPDKSVLADACGILTDSGVDLSAPIAIYPGRLLEIYHIEEILAAARETDEWQFIFIGEGEKQGLVETAAAREPNVFYPGSVPHEIVPGFLHLADVGLCLVDAERPLKILEFGASKLPVLGIPGTLQVEFSDQELWFSEPDAAAIIEMLYEISNAPEEAAERASALSEVAHANSWHEISEQYRRTIRRVVDR